MVFDTLLRLNYQWYFCLIRTFEIFNVLLDFEFIWNSWKQHSMTVKYTYPSAKDEWFG